MANPVKFNKDNNLELLRIIFAFQVLIVHAAEHLTYEIPINLNHLPGVPAFFFVSGFLIYASYCNAQKRYYFQNRFLRIFPALVAVTIGGSFLALFALGLSVLSQNGLVFLIWFLGQISLGQAYNPDIFRDIGVGVINGSLWTITTEILFYVMVPFIVWLEKRFSSAVILLSLFSFCIYSMGPALELGPVYRGRTLIDIISLTPIYWGWMFGLGILAVKHFEAIYKYINYLPLCFIPFLLLIEFGQGLFFNSAGNKLGIIYYVCYVSILFWIAFGLPAIRIGIDISYGIYIWHMPVLNIFLVINYPNFAWVVVFTVLAALMSWFFIELPALRLKQKSLKT